MLPGKFPSVAVAVSSEQLPRTSTGKVIRNGLAAVLQVSAPDLDVVGGGGASGGAAARLGAPKVSKALEGVRYFLACQVVFNHVGYQRADLPGTWGAVAQARFFCIHVSTQLGSNPAD